MNTSEEYQKGFNQAADDYYARLLENVTEATEDYQEGYHEGWAHNAELSPSEHKVCSNCFDGFHRPCHFCGAS